VGERWEKRGRGEEKGRREKINEET